MRGPIPAGFIRGTADGHAAEPDDFEFTFLEVRTHRAARISSKSLPTSDFLVSQLQPINSPGSDTINKPARRVIFW